MNIKGHNACVHSVPTYLANLAYTDVRATPKGFYVVCSRCVVVVVVSVVVVVVVVVVVRVVVVDVRVVVVVVLYGLEVERKEHF